MKITKRQLKRIIKEEIAKVLSEAPTSQFVDPEFAEEFRTGTGAFAVPEKPGQSRLRKARAKVEDLKNQLAHEERYLGMKAGHEHYYAKKHIVALRSTLVNAERELRKATKGAELAARERLEEAILQKVLRKLR